MYILTNRRFHLIYRLVYIGVALTGILASFIGWFPDRHNEFYVFFTNQANIIAIVAAGFLAFSALKDIKNKNINKKEDRFIDFEFIVFIYLIITAIFFNVFSPHENIFTPAFWARIQVWILHLVSPLLFSLDFILFSSKEKITFSAPFKLTIYPFAYSIFIIIRSAFLYNVGSFKESGYVVFPYPVYDYVTYGVSNIILIIFGFLFLTIGLGFLLRFIFQLKSKKI